MAEESNRWVLDLETTTDPNDCRVWAWGVVSIDDPQKFVWGKNLKTLYQWCAKNNNPQLWVHNLKFDAQFIISDLLTHGYAWENKFVPRPRTFTTLITPAGDYYSMKIVFTKIGRRSVMVEMRDSMKLLNFSVQKISQKFGIPFPKQKIDYDLPRPIGYEPTPQELHYLNADCKIVAVALKNLFSLNIDGFTIGQCAMNDFKKRQPAYKNYLPDLDEEIEEDIRQAYRGGFTYLNPQFADKQLGEGFFLDRNSMFPTMLYTKPMPCGRPIFFSGKYEPDPLYKLFIQKVSIVASLKPGKIPFLRTKNHPHYDNMSYLESTDGELLTFTLTSVEIELLFESYDVDDIVYHGGWKFRECTDLFKKFVQHWSFEKETSKAACEQINYTIAKSFLNSLYGKFGSRTSGRQAYPILDEEGIVRYKATGRLHRNSVYSPIALFCTAYARCDLIRTIQILREYGFKKYGRDVYVYSDTDSIVTTLPVADLAELDDLIELDDSKMGSWKLEKIFAKAKFLHAKCYMVLDYAGISHATIAGMPKALAERLKFEDFEHGFSTSKLNDPELAELRKLEPRHVKGGVVLEPIDFTIQ